MSEVTDHWQIVKREGLKITLKRSTEALQKDESTEVNAKIYRIKNETEKNN